LNSVQQDARPPFNIYTYGEQLLQNLSSSPEEPENNQGHKTFASLVQGQHKSEVCRSLSALLQLVGFSHPFIHLNQNELSEISAAGKAVPRASADDAAC